MRLQILISFIYRRHLHLGGVAGLGRMSVTVGMPDGRQFTVRLLHLGRRGPRLQSKRFQMLCHFVRHTGSILLPKFDLLLARFYLERRLSARLSLVLFDSPRAYAQ